MTDDAKSFFFNLLDTPSPTGFETPGQRVWTEYVRDHADEVETDAYGTAWAGLEGTAEDAPRVMLDAHVDEIGFMVRHITDDGFLYINRIGGSDRAIARGLRVRILGDDGPVTGVVGNTALHIRDTKNETVPEVHELFVDIGATSEDEVRERGLRVGHPMVFDVGPTTLTDSRITARAIDNRLGGFIIAQAVARLSEDRPAWDVQAANSVQEEIGGHGAKMIAHRLDPDAAVAFDVTHATDSPGINSKKHGSIEIGEGPTVTHGTSNHPQLVERAIEVAEAEDVPLQHEPSSRRTGTDTDSIFKTRSGVPSVLLSVPLRYMHSTVEVVDTNDIEHCVQLYAALVRSFEADEEFRVSL
ncbi:MAG: endoglucanase [Bacteroidetes bacterium SW_7_64_58]|jgi:endoglucanase|nr:MAG: endoglucanase [Bacteroidetes bacterium SW_7_64_58]